MSIMNRFNNNEESSAIDEPWVSAAVEQLRQPLDASISSQLRKARASALDRPARGSWLSLFFVWSGPTLASIVAIVLAIGFWPEPDNDMLLLQTAGNVVLEDLSIIKASDDLEFYQNLEFLLWMERTDNGLTKG